MSNEKRDILLHLYGEGEPDQDLRTLLSKPALKSEYSALSETKFRLDIKKKERPDRAVIDRILAASRNEATHNGKKARLDRGPVFRRVQLRKMLLPALSMAAVVVVSVGIGWIAFSNSTPEPILSSMYENEIVPPESLYRFVPSGKAGISTASSQSETLSWDDGSSIPNLHNRISSLKPTSPLDWGDSALPLEMLPSSNSRSGFQTAGSNK